ncbi:hypothetical protein GCM10009678_09940 [Actinomadura kijaniata]|uniref:Abortive infection protein n=1 Tax=Actinomadura namibiensis TaxID=182080 RepID=A0A7W3LJF8_ACTNM|nr:abortive infection protein [Actinomadura namibiensis]MBA8949266.1 hypothetical protein [Actinomadura namibiensis]
MIVQRGVNYDTERDVWDVAYVRRDMAAIRDELHCDSVILLGSSLRRLVPAAEAAAERGLFVWFEPRKFEKGARRTLRFLARTARAAEELRRDHPGVGISVGCEFTLFMKGLVPGRNWQARARNLGRPGSGDYHAGLNAFLGRALDAVRPVFGGPVTYSSGGWERVDWHGFDMVGVDLYRDARNAADYRRLVRDLHRHGRPVLITEFGCCTFRGAADRGALGFLAIDWRARPPRLRDGIVRDEREQARYLDELLDVFEAENVHGAFVYDFVAPGSPTAADPRYDLDTASFSLVKVAPPGSPDDYARTGRWEPKAAFHTVAARFARPGGSTLSEQMENQQP